MSSDDPTFEDIRVTSEVNFFVKWSHQRKPVSTDSLGESRGSQKAKEKKRMGLDQ